MPLHRSFPGLPSVPSCPLFLPADAPLSVVSAPSSPRLCLSPVVCLGASLSSFLFLYSALYPSVQEPPPRLCPASPHSWWAAQSGRGRVGISSSLKSVFFEGTLPTP